MDKERYKFGQRTLFYSGEELTTFDGFNLDDFMQIICSLLNQQDKQIKDLQEKLALTEKALELACEPRDDWGGTKYSGTEYDNYYDYFMAQAKEMLKNE